MVSYKITLYREIGEFRLKIRPENQQRVRDIRLRLMETETWVRHAIAVEKIAPANEGVLKELETVIQRIDVIRLQLFQIQ